MADRAPKRLADVLVLCYHAVSADWPLPMSVSPAQLERDVKLLLGRGYRSATFHDAVFAPPARRTFAVTFDDAFGSVFERAYPLLSELGVPATVFVPSDHTESGAPRAWPRLDRWLGTEHEHELAGMSWAELRELQRAGWEIGSHTSSHPRLTGLPARELRYELTASRLRCEERIGVSCRTLAYPYGDVDGRVAEAARLAGYAAAASLDQWTRRPDPMRWPRTVVVKATSERFAADTSAVRRWAKGSRVGPALRPLARRARALAAPGRVSRRRSP